MKRATVGLALGGLTMTMGLAACGTTTNTSTKAAALATINNKPITQAEMTNFVAGTEFMQGTKFPTTTKEKALELKAVVAQQAVNQWVMKKHLITTSAAKKQALGIVSTITKQVGSASKLTSLLKTDKLTTSTFENYLTNQVIAETGYKQVTKSVKAPTTAQEKAYYQKNKTQFQGPPKDEVSDILVKSKSLASSILKKAKAGTSFPALAKQYSIASNGSKGGSLGYLDVSGTSMSQGMYSAVASLKKGQFATYHGTKGYHVIWIQNTKSPTVQPFTTVKSQVATDLTQTKDSTVYQSFVAQLEKKDTIHYHKTS